MACSLVNPPSVTFVFASTIASANQTTIASANQTEKVGLNEIKMFALNSFKPIFFVMMYLLSISFFISIMSDGFIVTF